MTQPQPIDPEGVFDAQDWEDATARTVGPFYREALIAAGQAAAVEIGVDFNLRDPRVELWLGERTRQFAKDITATTLGAITRELVIAHRLGESIPQIRDRIQAVFALASKNRATVIARTEMITASNSGLLFAYKQGGIERKRWLTARDERVDGGDPLGICWVNQRAGAIPIDEAFPSGDQAPGAHPSCRCVLVSVTDLEKSVHPVVMKPYSGITDPNLPRNVRELPAGKRRQWLAVWNEVYQSCQAEAGTDCETQAFRAANEAVKSLQESSLTTGGALVPEIVLAAPQHTGAMIAYHLPQAIAEQLAVPEGEPADELHITVAYLGKALDIPFGQRLKILAAVEHVLSKRLPFIATISGIGRFPASESSDWQDVIYAKVDAPELADIRQGIAERLADAGIQIATDHEFTPHVTLAYVQPEDPSVSAIPDLTFTIDHLTTTFGDETVEHEFQRSAAEKVMAEVRCQVCHQLLGKNVSSGEFVCRACKREKQVQYIINEGVLIATLPLGVKSNPNHDEQGRFSSGSRRGGSSAIPSLRDQDAASADIKEYAELLKKVGNPDGVLLSEHGKVYHFDAGSIKGPRGKMHGCYQNAGRNALNDSSLTYVEGFVSVHGIPVSHAWTVDRSGKVLDPTLRDLKGVQGYYGVPFRTSYLQKRIMQTRYWGLLSDSKEIGYRPTNWSTETGFLAE